MLKRTIKAKFDVELLENNEWLTNFHSIEFEVCAESEDKLWEEAHMRCEAVCNEIKRDTGYEAIYQYTA